MKRLFSLILCYLSLSLFAQETKTLVLAEGIEMEFVRIPKGSFIMGSAAEEQDRQKDEGPQHSVTISQDFYLGKFEVTQSQWMALMGENPSVFHTLGSPEVYPVERITYHDCEVFIKKLNALGKGTFRIPTEAEWEYACRAGTQTRYPWGDDPEYREILQYSWFFSRAEGKSHPVGSKKPNPWGLYDMNGNLWEWCADWKGAYPDSAVVDPQGPAEGTHKIIRGGSWFNKHKTLRAANRNAHELDSKQTNNGLRVVWEIPD